MEPKITESTLMKLFSLQFQSRLIRWHPRWDQKQRFNITSLTISGSVNTPWEATVSEIWSYSIWAQCSLTPACRSNKKASQEFQQAQFDFTLHRGRVVVPTWWHVRAGYLCGKALSLTPAWELWKLTSTIKPAKTRSCSINLNRVNHSYRVMEILNCLKSGVRLQ